MTLPVNQQLVEYLLLRSKLLGTLWGTREHELPTISPSSSDGTTIFATLTFNESDSAIIEEIEREGVCLSAVQKRRQDQNGDKCSHGATVWQSPLHAANA